MAHVLDMHFQRCARMPLQMIQCILIEIIHEIVLKVPSKTTLLGPKNWARVGKCGLYQVIYIYIYIYIDIYISKTRLVPRV
jgi:hypothetical protein